MDTAQHQHRVATVDEGAEDLPLLSAAGKKIGHGVAAWVPVERRHMQRALPWEEAAGHPVIALLDTAVLPHSELPESGFVTSADWSAPVPLRDDWFDDFGSHAGHGTFVAGVVRLQAPAARLLSYEVMERDGSLTEENVVSALNHVSGVDVVCMAFGRTADPGEDPADPNSPLGRFRAAVDRLVSQGVTVVASAGNHGGTEPVYPAAFPGVIGVGAGASPTRRAPYSNYGDWVAEWWPGTDVVSTMPFTVVGQTGEGNGHASWSGTSFAAARCAAAQTVTEDPQPAVP